MNLYTELKIILGIFMLSLAWICAGFLLIVAPCKAASEQEMCMVSCDIPTAAEWQAGIEEAYRLALPVKEGQPLQMTADAPPINVDAFGICVVTVGGDVYTVGEIGETFAIQSICKPVMYELALQQHGRDYLLEHIGIEATGFPFNSIVALSVANKTTKS